MPEVVVCCGISREELKQLAASESSRSVIMAWTTLAACTWYTIHQPMLVLPWDLECRRRLAVALEVAVHHDLERGEPPEGMSDHVLAAGVMAPDLGLIEARHGADGERCSDDPPAEGANV